MKGSIQESPAFNVMSVGNTSILASVSSSIQMSIQRRDHLNVNSVIKVMLLVVHCGTIQRSLIPILMLKLIMPHVRLRGEEKEIKYNIVLVISIQNTNKEIAYHCTRLNSKIPVLYY